MLFKPCHFPFRLHHQHTPFAPLRTPPPFTPSSIPPSNFGPKPTNSLNRHSNSESMFNFTTEIPLITPDPDPTSSTQGQKP
ncbi:hypothetical protein VTJ04DRAFT_1431 [Mycothermus thermophilus]|uniref:uncharacterized protein n=1 Tax=Humicola insolens TaxID=85995 RepID=UPI003743E286